jgi:hypothetical protein
MVRLYTLNALSISDEQFCKETENWLQRLVQRATLISGASAKDRFIFFNSQKEKIENLIKKLNRIFSKNYELEI